MTVSRRSLLKAAAGAGGVAVAKASPVQARVRKVAPDDALGMLYDTTLCIGCKACVASCKEANNLPPDTRTPGMEQYDAPTDLNEYTKNIIKLFKDEDGRRSYVKRQCMHCVDPACVGACMIGALQKGDYGVVSWDVDRCIGCRYCQMACPFNIPKFEWTSTNPYIVKCEFCKDREGDKAYVPACCEVCPRAAVIYGPYAELLEEANKRLAENPDKYYPKIYGEKELGGTQVLYLSHVPFEKLGFQFSHEEPVPELQQTIQHGIYQGFIAPAALYMLLGGVMWRNHRQSKKAAEAEGESS